MSGIRCVIGQLDEDFHAYLRLPKSKTAVDKAFEIGFEILYTTQKGHVYIKF